MLARFFMFHFKVISEAEKLSPQLLTALLKDPSLDDSPQAGIELQLRDPVPSFSLHGTRHTNTSQTYIQAKHPYTEIFFNQKSFYIYENITKVIQNTLHLDSVIIDILPHLSLYDMYAHRQKVPFSLNLCNFENQTTFSYIMQDTVLS